MKLRTNEGNVVKLRDPVDIFNHFQKESKLQQFEPRIISGGKGGDKDWLSPLPVNTVFLIRDIHNAANFVMLRLRVAYKYEKAVLLYENMSEKPFAVVDPTRFCGQYQLVEHWLPEEETTIEE